MPQHEASLINAAPLFVTELMPPSNCFSPPASVIKDWQPLAFSFDANLAGLHISRGFTNDQLISWTGPHEQTEPESHVEDIGMRLRQITQIEGAKVLILTRKDLSLGRYLSQFGATVQNLLEAHEFVTSSEGVAFPAAVARLEGEWPTGIGGFDCVVGRHVLEHVFDLETFLSRTKKAMLPQGFLVLEVPDVEKQLSDRDPTLLWDEHRHYFTKQALANALERRGWHVLEAHQVTSDAEDLIWVVARPRNPVPKVEAAQPHEWSGEVSLVTGYFEFIKGAREGLRRFVAQSGIRNAVILGANHATAMFLNLVWPEEIPIRVIDDHPAKQGMQISRLQVPIVSLESLRLHGNELVFCGINRSRANGAIQRVKSKARNGIQVHMLQDLAEVLRS